MIPTHLIAAVIAGVISFTGAWQIQANRYEKIISDTALKHVSELAYQTKRAQDEAIRLQEKVDAANRMAQVRQSALARDVAAGRDALERLSYAADEALRRAGDSNQACLASSAAFADVFSQCRRELREMGEAADGHANDARTLSEAWPK